MFRFRKRQRALASKIELLIGRDIDAAATAYAESREDLDADDSARIASRIRYALEARDNNAYLSRALAEGTISPTAACELLEAYEAAGYVTADQFAMHRRHIGDAYRREFTSLLSNPGLEPVDYFRALDTYRAAGYVSGEELAEFELLLAAKVNPSLAARQLFDRARTTVDDELQLDLLQRYLLEFVGFPDFPKAASLFLSLKIDELWAVLPTIRTARLAAIKVHKLNALLREYLPITSDLSHAVPIDEVVEDFAEVVKDFKPEPDADRPITPDHINRVVVVVKKKAGEPGGYEEDRNALFSVGAKGRIRAVRSGHVAVEHKGAGLPYLKRWDQAAFHGSQFARVRPGSNIAVWEQEEVGLLRSRRPSPIFVHQFRDAVRTMAELLEEHRQDNPPPSSASLPSGERAERDQVGNQGSQLD